jgi:hypothetical protein
MLRWTLAALFALAATPSQALVRFEFAEAEYNAAVEGSDYIALGLGTGGYGFGFSDYGGCEGADEAGISRCGSYEGSGFSVTLSDNSFAYTAGLGQNQALVGPALSTSFSVYAIFRADREMRLRPTELRDFSVSVCDGSCTRGFGSGLSQAQQADGSWLAVVEAGTSAATNEGAQSVNHSFSVTLAEVPEPQAWAMLIAGFGLVGAVQRRRRASLA